MFGSAHMALRDVYLKHGRLGAAGLETALADRIVHIDERVPDDRLAAAGRTDDEDCGDII